MADTENKQVQEAETKEDPKDQNGQEESQNTDQKEAGEKEANLVEALKQALKEVLDEKNSDLVLVKKDCPFIPIRSLNGRDGSIYKDGEYINLQSLGRSFKVLGSFHIVRDTDLNLATCYVLGDDAGPSLIVPEVVLKELIKGGG